MSKSGTELVQEFTDEAELTEGERYQLLAAEQRRIALRALAERTDTATLTDVATEVAEQKSERDTPDVELLTRVKTALHHIHLPKLDDFGVIEYNPNSHRIGF